MSLKLPKCLVILMLYASFDLSSQSYADPEIFSELKYRNVGPTRGGRVTAVAGIESQPGIFYMGATGGGVWKTTDYGQNWQNVSDGFFESPSIGAIRVCQTDPKIVYVGTGSDGIRSNIIIGKGMYKSTDAGKTWKHIGLKAAGQITALEIHPANPDVVVAAALGNPFGPNAERGIFRTRNGGQSWEKVLFISDSTGFSDVEFAPGDPNTIYAGAWRAERKPWTIISGSAKEGGIYKSTDGGNTWNKLTKGLPQGLIGKIDFAVSPADPNRLYALIEAPEGQGGLYRSNDKGETFELISTKKELLDRPFYYLNVDANPLNANTLYVNSTSYFKSVDAGKTWTTQRSPHGDNHDMWINPKDSTLFIQCNDGGANVTRDGGRTWSTQHNQPTAELYQVAVDDQFPFWLYAGQQDNTTIAVPSFAPYSAPGGPSSFWREVGGCETGPAIPKPGDANIVYSNCKGRFGVYNKSTGQELQYYVGASNIYGHNPKDLQFRFQRVAPIHASIHDPGTVYHGSQYVHRTSNDGKTWEIISPDLTAFEPDKQVISGSPITRDATGEEYFSTIYEINESPLQEGILWVGANDGPIHVTTDGGKSWQNVTPKTVGPSGRVDCIEPSPHKAHKAYACILRYQLDDWKPYIFKTDDLGKTWTLITKGIPDDFPVRVVREDPDREGLLYAGTEYGMYISFDDGDNWAPFQQNLPVTPITDLAIRHKSLAVSTMGRSFWILDNLTSLHQWQAIKKGMQAFLYKPIDAYRLRGRGTGAGTVPSYPSPGAMIEYYLPKPVENLELQILDAQGKVVRSFAPTATRAPEATDNSDNPDMATGFRRQGASVQPGKKAGINRFIWDLRRDGFMGANNRTVAGVLTAPGVFTVRLQVDGRTVEQPLKVWMDPRLVEAGVSLADLKAQEDLAINVQQLREKAFATNEDLKKQLSATKEIEKLAKKKALEAIQALALKLENLSKELNTAEGRYMTPMLIDQLSYLASMLDQADQRPGDDAYDRYDELNRQLQKIVGELKGAAPARP